MADANWLLSTTAQSAAALVAIVGGFLVSRLIGLHSAREGLSRQLRDTRSDRASEQRSLDETVIELRTLNASWFTHHHLKAVVNAGGDIEIDELLKDYMPTGSDADDMREVAEVLVAKVRTAIGGVIEAIPDGKPEDEAHQLRGQGVTIPPGDEEIFEAVARKIAGERRSGSPRVVAVPLVGDFRMPDFDLSTITPIGEQQRHSLLVDRGARLQRRIESLDAQDERLTGELAMLGRPRGIVRGMVVLSYLALVSVALPLLLMARRPVPDSWLVRYGVVGLFVSGLALLVGYLIWWMRALAIDPEAG